jgi:hypothetical protein
LTVQDQPIIPEVPVETATPEGVLPVVTETEFVPPTETPQPTETPVFTVATLTPEEETLPPPPDDGEPLPDEPDAPSTVLLEDDFESGNIFGWEEEDGGTLRAVIEEGVFNAELQEPGTFWLSQTGRIFGDFTFSADVTLGAGSDDPDSGAGLVFRIEDTEHFYFFEVNGVDSYRLQARNDGEWVTLIDWFPDPAILPAGSTNTLQVRAEADRLTLFVNESQVAVTDLLAWARRRRGNPSPPSSTMCW